MKIIRKSGIIGQFAAAQTCKSWAELFRGWSAKPTAEVSRTGANLVKEVAVVGRVKLLEWVMSFGYPWTITADHVAMDHGHLKLIKVMWDMKHYHYRVHKGAIWDHAIKNDLDNAVVFAIELGVVFDCYNHEQASHFGAVKVLDVMYKKLHFEPIGAYLHAVKSHQLGVLEWIHSYGMLPEMCFKRMLIMVEYGDNYHLINWILRMGLMGLGQSRQDMFARRVRYKLRDVSQTPVDYCRDNGWHHLELFLRGYEG